VYGLGPLNTARTWLSMWSLKESQCQAAPHLARIALPSLVVPGTADNGVFDSDAQSIYDGLAATDKTLIKLHADHYFLEPAGRRDELADTLTGWVAAHGG
jgi:esterase/lipase